jgi:uncharacterized membrane protein
MLPAASLLPEVAQEIRQEHLPWSSDGAICKYCVAQGKSTWLQHTLQAELGTLTAEELFVIRSIRERKLVSRNANEASPPEEDPGSRFAERLTAVVGNWRFSGVILLALGLWLGVNLILRPFEPYPVIIYSVISAVLAALAALQGPVILMNQRRQQMRARLQAEIDYQVNLKAELEIRYLQEAVDKLLSGREPERG